MDQYIKTELFILIPFLYGLGMILKDTTLIKDKYIPLVLTAVSLVLANLYVIGTGGFSAVNLFTGIVQGVLCVATAVYANQITKQLFK
jgi:hypothetical protein